MMIKHSSIRDLTAGLTLALACAAGASGSLQPPSAGGAAAPVAAPVTPNRALPARVQVGSEADRLWADRAEKFGGDEWVTRPSRDAALGFTSPLEVQELLVKPGMRVKLGQRLIRAKDGEVLAGLRVQEQKAANDTEVQNAKAGQELAQSRFDAVEKVMLKDAGTQAEYEERRIGLASAKIQVAAAEKKLEEEVLRLEQLREQAKRYYIDAPFDGVVDALVAEVGQTVTERDPVVRVVNVNPLWIDVPVKTETTIAQGLATGHEAWALLDLPGDPVILKGKVLYVSSVADSASGTRRVRVEVENPSELPAGTRARVRFTAPTGALAAATDAGVKHELGQGEAKK